MTNRLVMYVCSCHYGDMYMINIDNQIVKAFSGNLGSLTNKWTIPSSELQYIIIIENINDLISARLRKLT